MSSFCFKNNKKLTVKCSYIFSNRWQKECERHVIVVILTGIVQNYIVIYMRNNMKKFP